MRRIRCYADTGNPGIEPHFEFGPSERNEGGCRLVVFLHNATRCTFDIPREDAMGILAQLNEILTLGDLPSLH